MKRDIVRILLWLGVLAGCVSAFLVVYRYAPGSSLGAVMALPIALAVAFLIMGIFAAGKNAPVEHQGNVTIHRLSWGAIQFLGIISAAAAGFILFALQSAAPFWLWSLTVPGIALCIYFFAGALLYRVQCDERRLCIRGWLFRWACHDWDDLVSIYHDEDQLRLLFEKTEYAELAGYMTGIDRIHTIAQVALDCNNRARGTDNA